jgi:hypothetical protein
MISIDELEDRFYLGLFKDKMKAVAAYCKAAEELFGEFRRV